MRQVAASCCLTAGGLCLAALPPAQADPPDAGARRPNVVFILADDLGYTDLACYGSKYYETPGIDRLAARGMRFTNGYTCGPNCQPTRAALLSGQYGPRSGVYTVGNINRFNWQSRPLRPVDNVTDLPLETVTIAQALKRAGYATGMFGKWHLGNDAAHHPGRRGFDEAVTISGRVHFDFKTDPHVAYPDGKYLADFLADQAVDFIRRHRNEPFFLYLPHFAVHAPYQAKRDLIARFEARPAAGGHHHAIYAAMIASIDESVGRIVALLEELKLAENTLVIFSSDNGGVGGYVREGLREAGDVTDNAPLRGGKGMLREGGIRVPWIFCWPGQIAAGSTSDEPITSVDLYPTLLELAGARPPDDAELDGVSLLGLLTGPPSARLDRDAIFWHFPGYLGIGQGQWRTTPTGVIRSGDWKLQEFFEDGRIELFNLREDIGEKNNLAARMPDKVAALHARLVAWRKQVGARMPTPNAARSEAAQPAPRNPNRRANRANRANPENRANRRQTQ